MFSRSSAILFAFACVAGSARADVTFHCPAQVPALQHGVPNYLRTLGISATQVAQTLDARSGELTFALTTPPSDTRTLDLFMRPDFALSTERVSLPTATRGKMRVLNTVSRKEIMLALLQHGRVTSFSGESCSVEALSDRVGLRQNIVAWAEQLNWDWPDGGPARWNTKYWNRGTPIPGVSLHAAVMDAFLHQDKYAMGCYTATKLVMVQGTLDYYSRVKRDPVRTRRVEKALLADGDPLVGIEPGSMWSFEKDYDAQEMAHKGKLLKLYSAVAAGNFIPGDWGYIVNTDPVSEQKTGYEGSNAIYLGRNRFDDYYNDNDHSYTYEQKLDEVYQWRNGVFSRSRDAAKIQHLTPEQQALLSNTPEGGGLQLDVRAAPRFF
ncbi:MAG TPA: hypothetical protein VIU93_08275 [Gallionellaceae bacterium]